MAFKLTIEQGKGRGQAFDFDAEQISIGRTDENDVVLYDGGVSRNHARIELDGDEYFLADLGSANGTLLNGNKIEREALEDGDTIGIGQVTFRFGLVQAQEGATRIVSLEQAEAQAPADGATRIAKVPPEPKGPRTPRAATGGDPFKPGLDPKVLKIGAVVGGALLLLAIVGAMFKSNGDGAGGGKRACGTLALADVSGFVLGNTVEAECDAGDRLKLGFNQTPKTRAILSFGAFNVQKGELEVYLNDSKIGEAQLAPTRRSSRQSIVLPEGKLKEGAANYIEFRNTKGDDWGVERVELEVIGLNEADVAKARESFLRGTKLYQNRNVAARNLYDAWIELREARRYMEGLDPKPSDYQVTLDTIRDIEKELDRLCKEKMFKATREAKYGNYEGANDAYRFVLAAFGDKHPCRAQAEASMYAEDKPGEE